MKPVMQTRTGKQGNCFSACMASILELGIHEVPRALAGPDQYQAAKDFLRPLGYTYERVPITDVKPVGLHLIEGVSPRGGMHAVVGRDGRMIHDPHPHDGTGRGLAQPQLYGMITKLK